MALRVKEPGKERRKMADTLAKVPVVVIVPHKIRRARALRRKAAIRPMIEERKDRQKRSREHLLNSSIEPTSGHVSLRPNRHASRRKKLESYTNA